MNRVAKPASPSHWRILRAPLALFVATLIGLTAALLGEGWVHIVAWLLLAAPIIVMAWAIRR